jgi:hypothetical protein
MIEGAHGDVHGDQSAQAGGEGRQPAGEVLRVREHEHIGVESLAVGPQELREVQ